MGWGNGCFVFVADIETFFGADLTQCAEFGFTPEGQDFTVLLQTAAPVSPKLTGEVFEDFAARHDDDGGALISFAAQVAQRAIFMDKGRIVEEGDPKTVFASPQSERLKQFLNTWRERSI